MPARPGHPLLLAASARRNGNTDHAAAILRQALADQGREPDLLRIADLTARPCIACGYCDTHPGACVLDAPTPDGPDVALPLLRALAEAPAACLLSPTYFYHLPARAKGLIDRAQSFWAVPPEKKPGRGKRLGVILLGARPRGDQLFAGSLLTLRYMADALGLTLAEPLLLYGLDAPNALSRRPDLEARVREYALAPPFVV